MLNELRIIERIGRLSGRAVNLADDAFWDADANRIYTTDLLVEGRHFDMRYFTPESLGWKAAAVNISDVAAMAGQLRYVLVSLGLPDTVDELWVERFYEGLLAVTRRFGGEIAGGDTVGSDRVVVNVTAIGERMPGRALGRRDAAQVGDVLVATGWHGLSHVGLLALQAGLHGYEEAKTAHLKPMPRIEEGLYLAERQPRFALMDSSDGLADAVLKIARASRVRIVLDAGAVPVHPEISAYAQATGLDPWRAVLYGGEDFELVAAVPQAEPDILQHFRAIGRVEDAAGQPGAILRHGDGREEILQLESAYQHFGDGA